MNKLDDVMADLETELLYCWYCEGYFPREEMGDVMCLECEAGGGPDVVRNYEVFVKALAEVKKKHERVKGIGKIVRMTIKEGMK